MSDFYREQFEKLSDEEKVRSAVGHLRNEGFDPDAEFVQRLWEDLLDSVPMEQA